MSDSALQLPTAPYGVIGLVASGWSPDALLRGAADALSVGEPRPLPSAARPGSMVLETPSAGVVLVASRVDKADPRHVAIDISFSGELLGGPSWISLSPQEEAELERTREFTKGALAAICAQLQPLYAGVGVEWSIPVPSALRENWLPYDVFWSVQLEAADSSLSTDLGDIYGVSGRPFQEGKLIAAGGLLDAAAEPPLEPLAAGRAAARRMAVAVASIPSYR